MLSSVTPYCHEFRFSIIWNVNNVTFSHCRYRAVSAVCVIEFFACYGIWLNFTFINWMPSQPGGLYDIDKVEHESIFRKRWTHFIFSWHPRRSGHCESPNVRKSDLIWIPDKRTSSPANVQFPPSSNLKLWGIKNWFFPAYRETIPTPWLL